MSFTTAAKTSLVTATMALTLIQLQSVIVNQAMGQAPLTAPLTNFVTPTPTWTPPLTSPVVSTPTPTPTDTPPLTAPEPVIEVTDTPTPTPTAAPTSAPANNNNGGSNNGGGSNNNNSNNGGGSSNNNSGGSSNVCRDTRPVSAPIILTARATGGNQVTLTWKKGWAPFNGYIISYGTKHGITQYTMDVSGANTTTATVGGLTANTVYYFRIQAKNGCVTGDYSRELSVRTYGKILPVTKILGSKIKKTVPVKSVKAVVIKKKK